MTLLKNYLKFNFENEVTSFEVTIMKNFKNTYP